jgi:protein-S-isoprenylcysteine O-methyltransferase Ste14
MSPGLIAGGQKPWWKGVRGEWLVVLQVVLIGLVAIGPRTIAGWPALAFPFPRACLIVGCTLIAAGGVLGLPAFVFLGRGVTPMPYPKTGAPLVETGPYAIVRHPMYAGGFLVGLGWALCIQGWLTLGFVGAFLAFIDFKSRVEERWLTEKFPEYAAYQRRVRKIIPFVY